jgi:hypothetical protein
MFFNGTGIIFLILGVNGIIYYLLDDVEYFYYTYYSLFFVYHLKDISSVFVFGFEDR